MLKFLRHIRKKLIEEDNVRKYLLYAIGEILLVVIGILIALQVNNWNEHRLELAEERVILNSLNEEFNQNRKLIRKSIEDNQVIIDSGVEMMELMGQNREAFEGVNIDSLLYLFLGPSDFNLSNTSVENVIQSGKMNVLNNAELVNKIYEWEAFIGYLTKREQKRDQWNYDHVMPLMSQYISFREMDLIGGFRWTGKSNLEHDFHPMFQNLIF